MTPTAGWTGAIRPCAARSTSAARRPGSRSPTSSRCPSRCSGTTRCGCGCSPPCRSRCRARCSAAGSPTGWWPARPTRRWPPIVAAIVGGASVLGIQQYFHYLLSNQSDSMLVAVGLAALDCALCGRYRWAYCLGILGSLGRPEFWPPVFLFTIWAWRAHPQMRKLLLAGPVLVAFLWFGVPTITNDRPNIAGQLALRSPRECKSNKIVCTTQRFFDAGHPRRPARGARRAGDRRRCAATGWCSGSAGCVVLWVLTEIGFALHGFPGVPRYLFEAAGLTGVLAGVGVGCCSLDASRLWSRLPRWAGVPVAAVLVAFMIPERRSPRLRLEHKDIRHEQRAHEGDQQAGGARSTRSAAINARASLRPAGAQRRVRQHHGLVHAPQHGHDRLPAPDRAAPPQVPDRRVHDLPQRLGREDLPDPGGRQGPLREHERALSCPPPAIPAACWSPSSRCPFRPRRLPPDGCPGDTRISPRMRRRIKSAAFPVHRHALPQLLLDGVLVALAYLPRLLAALRGQLPRRATPASVIC